MGVKRMGSKNESGGKRGIAAGMKKTEGSRAAPQQQPHNALRPPLISHRSISPLSSTSPTDQSCWVKLQCQHSSIVKQQHHHEPAA